MKRITTWVIAATTTVLIFALPAFAQQAAQDSCDWYWDYNYVKSGGWEYWCWNPTMGWWYSTDGKAKTTNVSVQSQSLSESTENSFSDTVRYGTVYL